MYKVVGEYFRGVQGKYQVHRAISEINHLYLRRFASYPLYIEHEKFRKPHLFPQIRAKPTTFFCARVCPSFVLVCRLYHVKFQLVCFTLSISLAF